MAVVCQTCFAVSDIADGTCLTCGRSLASGGSGTPRIVAARYEILRSLGEGGMGRVYEAHDIVLDETVALKFLRADVLAAPDLARRFRSEIKLARKVSHRNVCRIYEYGEEGGHLYISMELLEGQDVRHLVAGGPLPWPEAYDIVIQAAQGLQAIHEVGIVHRDLKPANLTRDVHGVVKLMDFGLAKQWEAAEVKGITGTGQVVGTPEYMSPEQVRGQKIGFQSDLYALGIVAFELFTGDVPFRGDTPIATILLHVQEPVPLDGPRAEGIPEPLRPVLARALAKDAHERFATAQEMVEALQRAQAATPLNVGAERAPLIRMAGQAGDPRLREDPDLVPTRVVPHLVRPGRQRRSTPEPRLLIPPLLRALRNEDKDIRAGAARALGQLGPEGAPAITQLVRALHDPNWEVRTQACHAVRKMGPAARAASDALREAGRDEDERVRQAAARALSALVEPAPAPAPASRPRLVAVPAPASRPRLVPAPAPAKAGLAALAAASQAVSRADALPPEAAPVPVPSKPPQPSPSFTFARPTLPGPRQRLWLGVVLATASLVAALAFFRSRATAPVVQPLPSVPPAPATPAPASEAAAQALARIQELEGRLASMEAERKKAEEEARRKATQRPPTETAAVDPALVRAADERARQRLERELAQQRQDLERERQAFLDLQARAAGAAPPPAAEPSIVPTVTEAPPATPAPLPRRVEPGTLVNLGDPGVSKPVAIANPAPPYTLLAERLGLQGTVELRLLVDERGNVLEAEPVTGARQLSDAAIRHVKRKWKYRPATLDGVPVRVRIPVTIRFEMR